MQLSSARTLFRERLQKLYPEQEIDSIFSLAVQHVLNYSKMQIHQNSGINLSPESEDKILDILHRLGNAEPIQYILGETEFYGLMFRVNKTVLVPRPETEIMTDMIIKKYGKISGLKIIDVGTGSGCIAVSLARNLLHPQITAIDLSSEALELARNNAILNHAEVQFLQDDFLNLRNNYPQFNILVSNPPYVTDSEKKLMQRNVLEFEPPGALFVSDSDPLIFYRHLADFAQKHLRPGGELFLEINERFPAETASLFSHAEFSDLLLHDDLSSKKRYLTALKTA